MLSAIIGWIGSILFAFCGLPQAHKTWKDGHANGLDIYFLLLWTGGEIGTITAVAMDHGGAYLLFNYLVNLIWLGIMWRYKLYPRRLN